MDQVTIEAARRGDRDAQATLLRRLGDVWYRMSLGLLANADDARDAVQETALRFLRDLPRYRGDSSISTWSIGIAINVAREMRRKAGSSQRAADNQQLASVQSGAEFPEDSVSTDEHRGMLHRAMEHLSDRQREAVMLRYFEEMSVEDTAAAMQCATGTVKATVHQALRILKAKLKALA
ncbi:MAG TPA: sigma-70 family RNA polymerase sigma factor [Tepidisphaeraceae bacterium]|nr:sigma-70 family RNA polymerase sigma factor [Tepidisphaeraceae bacterium]